MRIWPRSRPPRAMRISPTCLANAAPWRGSRRPGSSARSVACRADELVAALVPSVEQPKLRRAALDAFDRVDRLDDAACRFLPAADRTQMDRERDLGGVGVGDRATLADLGEGILRAVGVKSCGKRDARLRRLEDPSHVIAPDVAGHRGALRDLGDDQID